MTKLSFFSIYRKLDKLKPKIKLWIDWFIAPSILNGNEDVLRRARLIVSYLSILVIAAFFFIAIYIWMGSQVSAVMLEATILIAIFALYIIRKFGAIIFVNNIFTTTIFVVFTVMATRLGGFDATVFAWYVAVPLITLSVSNKQSAFFWLVVIILSVIIFYILYINGYSFQNDVNPFHYKILILIGWIGIFTLIFFFTLQFEITKDQMLQKLQNSEKRLRDIANSMGEWVWEIDTEGRYTHASGKVEKILGYSIEEIIGKTPFDFMTIREKERVSKIFYKTIANKKPIKELESWSIGKNGKKVCMLTNGRPIFDENGKLLGYRGVNNNITERKEKEKLLHIKNEELEMFNETMLNREIRMIELKEEVNTFAKQLGQKPPYPLIWKKEEGGVSEK